MFEENKKTREHGQTQKKTENLDVIKSQYNIYI